jgi:hypothetical protein
MANVPSAVSLGPNACQAVDVDSWNSAGDTVTVEMHQQPADRSCANEAIGGDHYGPINVSLFPVLHDSIQQLTLSLFL